VSTISFMQRIFLVAAALLLVALPAQAQQKPAVIVSISNVDDTLADIRYVTQAAGVPQLAGVVQLFGAQYFNLLDMSAPAGITAVVNGPEPEILAFLPVKDFAGLRKVATDFVGPPEDQGDGVWLLNGPQPVYMKQAGNYVFIAQNEAGLNNLPQNPAALLEGLDKRYNIGVRFHIQRIPAQMRDQFVAMMQQTMAQSGGQFGEDEAQPAFQKAMAASSAKNIELMATQGDIFEMGIAIDEQNKEIKLEYSVTALQDSELAEELSYIQDAETRFGAILDPKAAVVMNITSKLGQTQMSMGKDLLKVFRSSIEKEIKEDGNFPNEQARQAAEKVVSDLLDVAEATLASGKVDSAAAVTLDGSNLQFSAAAHIAAGDKLNQTIRDIVELAREEPEFPEAKLDAAKVGDVSIHLLQVPIPAGEDDARAVFGDKVEIAVGVGPDAAYLSVGPDAVDNLKKLADRDNTKSVRPMAMRFSVGQLIKFGANFNDDPQFQDLLPVIEQMGDNDHVEVVVEAIPNGARYKLGLEDGILKLIGVAAQKAMAGGF
jgi:hypothetical protein